MGKKKGKNSTGHGNPYLARILGNAAATARKTDAFLGERHRRIARHRGAKKANARLVRRGRIRARVAAGLPIVRRQPSVGVRYVPSARVS